MKNLITTLLLLTLLSLTSATPVPVPVPSNINDGEDGDTGANYVQCLDACNGDSTACLAVPKDPEHDYTVLGVTFMCQAEAFMCQTLCSGTLSFETVVKDWVPAAKAVLMAWQDAKGSVPR